MSCPSWCVNTACDLEHWADPGGAHWPAVTANPEGGGTKAEAVAHPSWCEMDGLAPAVSLWANSGRQDFTLDFTPDEAERLADRLMHAARAVRQG